MGEDIFLLAELYYGAWWMWEVIHDYNREIIGDDPESIPIGTLLYIPLMDEPIVKRHEVLKWRYLSRRHGWK